MTTPLDRLKDIKSRIGFRLQDLLVMEPANDPFGTGMPSQIRDGEWIAGLWERFGWRQGVHLRRMHYALQSSGEVLKPDGRPYVNDRRSWELLVRSAKYARHLGLVDPTLFDDKRATEKIYLAAERRWIAPEVGAEIDNIDFDGFDITVDTSKPSDSVVPWVSISGYDYEPDDQPYHLEVWVEKSTVNDILQPICSRYQANLIVGVGYQSISNTIELLQRVRKPTRILYVSDFDNAGERMPVAVARVIEFYRDRYAPDFDVVLDPVALTAAQVEEYNLPTAPDGWEVELDALVELRPGTLNQIVGDRLKAYRDATFETRLRSAEREATRLFAGWADIRAPFVEEFRRINSEIGAVVEEYEAALTEALEPFAASLEILSLDSRTAATEYMESLDVELPARPDPDIEVDESNVMFDSRREYWEQLQHYRVALGREPLTPSICAAPGCGEEFWPRTSNQKYHSLSCGARGRRAGITGGAIT